MKNSITALTALAAVITFASFTFTRSVRETEVPYPEGYRMWTHVKTILIGPASPNFQLNGGYHHIYANATAMQGYTTGYFPNGSVLVFDVLDTKELNGNIQESSRKRVDVMIKDSLKYTTTGGWGYEEFKGDSHTERLLTPTVKTQCFNCHAKNDDFIFSEFRK